MLRERGPQRGQEDHRAGPHRLRRGGTHPPAVRTRGGRGAREAPDGGDRGGLRRRRAGGHPSPGQLAGQQGLPGAHRRGAGETGTRRVHQTGRR